MPDSQEGSNKIHDQCRSTRHLLREAEVLAARRDRLENLAAESFVALILGEVKLCKMEGPC